MRAGSLRTRITLWNVVVLGFALALSAWAVHYLVRGDLTRRLDEDMLVEAKHFESITAAMLRSGSTADLRNDPAARQFWSAVTEGHQQSPSDAPLRSRVLAPNGRPVLDQSAKQQLRYAPYDAAGLAAALRGSIDYRTLGSGAQAMRLLSYPSMPDGKAHFVVQTIRPMAPVEQTVTHLDRAMLHFAPIALLVALIGGAFLTQRSLKPIKEMAAAAETVRAESLGQRLPAQGNDELSRLATVFNRMLDRLESSFETQGRFIADASHELRTPLTALKANTSLALSGQPSLEEYRTALTCADKAADRMVRLVNDLLFLSRCDAGQLEPRDEQVDLAIAVHSAVELFRAQADRDGVVLTSEVADGMVARGDADYVDRLLANLVSNALRHTPRGGSVAIAATLVDDNVELRVEDTGTGIPHEHLSHIFERFYRADSARSRTDGGSGLGLAICQSMATAMGGSICLSSEPGKGTIATVRLRAASPIIAP